MKWIRAQWDKIFDKVAHVAGVSTEGTLAIVSILVGFTQFVAGQGLPHSAFIYMDPDVVTAALGVLYIVAGVALLIGLWYLDTSWSRVIRRVGSFLAFLAFLYTGLIGVFSDDISLPVAFMALGLAVIAGFLHIKEKQPSDE